MDWQKGETSNNVEVDSGGGGGPRFGGGRRMGLGGLLVLAVLGWVFFKNPMALLSQGGGQPATTAPSAQPAQVDPQQMAFVEKILGSTEKAWGDIFASMGRTYTDAKLDLFSGSGNTVTAVV